MRTLLLARHAHAAGPPPGQGDFDRPLSARGIAEAEAMGLRLARMGQGVDHVVCSAAIRAHHTAHLLARGMGFDPAAIEMREPLYGAGLSRLVATAEELDDRHRSVLLVNHNPGITELSNWLWGEWHGGLAPCTVVRFQLDLERWLDIDRGMGPDADFFVPGEA